MPWRELYWHRNFFFFDKVSHLKHPNIHTSVEKGLNNYTVLRSVDSDADNACSGVFLMSKLPLRGGTWSAWENDDGSRVMLWKPINPISYVEVKRLKAILLN